MDGRIEGEKKNSATVTLFVEACSQSQQVFGWSNLLPSGFTWSPLAALLVCERIVIFIQYHEAQPLLKPKQPGNPRYSVDFQAHV